MLRIVALGNRQKKDDAVAIAVAEALKNKLCEKNIDIIVGDIDYEYCFESINEDDYLIILLASHSEKNPGSLQICKISEAVDHYSKNHPSDPYNLNIFNLMKLFQISYSGYIISINVPDIEFGMGLSAELKDAFFDICRKIEIVINNIQNEIC